MFCLKYVQCFLFAEQCWHVWRMSPVVVVWNGLADMYCLFKHSSNFWLGDCSETDIPTNFPVQVAQKRLSFFKERLLRARFCAARNKPCARTVKLGFPRSEPSNTIGFRLAQTKPATRSLQIITRPTQALQAYTCFNSTHFWGYQVCFCCEKPGMTARFTGVYFTLRSCCYASLGTI